MINILIVKLSRLELTSAKAQMLNFGPTYKYEIIEDHSITHYLLIRYCSNNHQVNIDIV